MENAHYDQDNEIIKIDLKPLRNKLILNKIDDEERSQTLKIVFDAPEYGRRISDKYIDKIKSYEVIFKSEEDATSVHSLLKEHIPKESKIEIQQIFEDLYVHLLQKAQDQIRYQQIEQNSELQNEIMMQQQAYAYYNGGYYYPGMYNNMNYYYGYPQNQMFIRKSGDYASYDENMYANNYQGGNYSPEYYQNGNKKGRGGRKGQQNNFGSNSPQKNKGHNANDSHSPNHHSKNKSNNYKNGKTGNFKNGNKNFKTGDKKKRNMTKEDIEKKIGFSEESFPPLTIAQNWTGHSMNNQNGGMFGNLHSFEAENTAQEKSWRIYFFYICINRSNRV